MGRVITVASGKGGTGKTTTAAAVSSCLAALGHRTLCIDCDAGLRNLDIALGMTEFSVADFADVLEDRLALSEAYHESPDIPNLFFLSAPPFRKPEDFYADAMAELYDAVRAEFEFCLVDAPSGIGAGLKLAAAAADMVIIVTTDDATSMRDARSSAELIRDFGVAELRLLINRYLPRRYKRLQATIDDVIDTVGVQLIGIVNEDEAVSFALHDRIPLVLYPERRAAYGFLDVARRLRGEDLLLSKRQHI